MKLVAAGAFLLFIAFTQMVDIAGLAFESPDRKVGMILLLGAILSAAGVLLARGLGVDADDERTVSLFALIVGFAISVVLFFWLVPFGRYEAIAADVIAEPGTVARSTKVPWTIMMILLVLGYVVGLASARYKESGAFKVLLGVWWMFGPAFIIFLVLRDPAFDLAHIWSTDLPMAFGFAFGGGALLFFLSAPDRGELARAVGAILLAFSVFNWFAAFGDVDVPFLGSVNFQWYPWASPPAGVEGTSMLQKARISFLLLALVALLAPNFAGELRARLRFVGS